MRHVCMCRANIELNNLPCSKYFVRLILGTLLSRHLELQQIVDFSEVDGHIASASIHGALVSMSWIKNACNSEGKITDGRSKMQFVGFHKEQQKKVLQLKEKIVVQLNNCEVKKSRNSEKLDVILKSCIEIR